MSRLNEFVAVHSKHNDCKGCVGERNGPLCGDLGVAGNCYDRSIIFKEKEPMTEANQQVAGPQHEAALQQALALPPASFATERQKAWDAYADSRAKITGHRPSPLLPRAEGFMEGYAQGFAAAEPLLKALRLASDVKPAPRKGKLVDLIVESLRIEGPASAHTLAVRLGRQLNSVSPRTISLRHRGHIVVTGSEPATNGKGVREVYAAAAYTG
jgi:hypothetical protein